MSHTTVHERSCRDARVLERACKRVGAEFLGLGEHRLYDGAHRGLGVRFDNWNYPIIFDEQGNARCDTFNGNWGDMADLDRLCQAYGAEAPQVAYAGDSRVLSIQETLLPNGEVEVRVLVGGGTSLVGAATDSPFAESSR